MTKKKTSAVKEKYEVEYFYIVCESDPSSNDYDRLDEYIRIILKRIY